MQAYNGNSTTPKEDKDLAQTPWWFIKSVEHYFESTIDIDLCCIPETAKAEYYYSLVNGDDALESNWGEDALEFGEENPLGYCNMPFSNILPWIEKAEHEADTNNFSTIMLMPNTPETAYVRRIKKVAELVIEMPFRLRFLRPNGEPFISQTTGRENQPKFSCLLGLVTKEGLSQETRHTYHDFREGFKPRSGYDIDLTTWRSKDV